MFVGPGGLLQQLWRAGTAVPSPLHRGPLHLSSRGGAADGPDPRADDIQYHEVPGDPQEADGRGRVSRRRLLLMLA